VLNVLVKVRSQKFTVVLFKDTLFYISNKLGPTVRLHEHKSKKGNPLSNASLSLTDNHSRQQEPSYCLKTFPPVAQNLNTDLQTPPSPPCGFEEFNQHFCGCPFQTNSLRTLTIYVSITSFQSLSEIVLSVFISLTWFNKYLPNFA